MKKVSVIIPVYNSEKYLSRCLDSIIAQTLNEIEIICVDNGSIDNSAELIKSYIARDSRIKLISTENHGPGAARNIGIKEATGEYLGFVDSDDWVDKDYYEKLYSVAKKYDVEISCCGLIREHKNRKKYRFNFKSEKIIENIYDKLKEMKVPDISYSVNKLYKKSFITKNNLLYPENVFFEDVPFMFKAIFYCDKIATVPDTFYHYFANPNSIVKTKSTKKAQDKIDAYKEVREFAKKNNIILSEKDLIAKTSYIKVLGIPIIKTKYFDEYKKDYLFGIIYLGKKS